MHDSGYTNLRKMHMSTMRVTTNTNASLQNINANPNSTVPHQHKRLYSCPECKYNLK